MNTTAIKNPPESTDLYSALGISQKTQEEIKSQLQKIVGPCPGPVPSLNELREMLQKQMGDLNLSDMVRIIRDEE